MYYSLIYAIKLQVAHSRSLNTSRKAKILFESKNIGEEYEMRARQLFQRRNFLLKYIKQLVAKRFDKIKDKNIKLYNDRSEEQNFREMITYIKESLFFRLLHSEDSDMSVKKAKEKIDNVSTDIKGLKTIQDLYDYLQKELNSLIEERIGNPNGWTCLLALILLIFYGPILVSIILYCTTGQVIDAVTGELLHIPICYVHMVITDLNKIIEELCK